MSEHLVENAVWAFTQVFQQGCRVEDSFEGEKEALSVLLDGDEKDMAICSQTDLRRVNCGERCKPLLTTEINTKFSDDL